MRPPAPLGAQEYQSPGQLWSKQRDDNGSFNTWYNSAVNYWDGQEASYNGVLGGYGFVSDIDVRDSRLLLEKVCAGSAVLAIARVSLPRRCGACSVEGAPRLSLTWCRGAHAEAQVLKSELAEAAAGKRTLVALGELSVGASHLCLGAACAPQHRCGA